MNQLFLKQIAVGLLSILIFTGLVGCVNDQGSVKEELDQVKSDLVASSAELEATKVALTKAEKQLTSQRDQVQSLNQELETTKKDLEAARADAQDRSIIAEGNEMELVQRDREIEELKEVIDQLRSSGDTELKINFTPLDASSKTLRYTTETELTSKEKTSPRQAYELTIVAGDAGPLLDVPVKHLEGPGDLRGEEVRVNIIGRLPSFKIIGQEWNDNKQELVETSVVTDLGEVRNETLVVDTYLAEGIPSGKLVWVNEAGDTFEYLLSQDGFGFSGEIRWCK